jgi:DNA repair protein SbcC/Rad50
MLDDPVAHVDDLNMLAFLDYLREIAITGSRQIFFATADEKVAAIFNQKFLALKSDYAEIPLTR